MFGRVGGALPCSSFGHLVGDFVAPVPGVGFDPPQLDLAVFAEVIEGCPAVLDCLGVRRVVVESQQGRLAVGEDGDVCQVGVQ